MCVCKDVFVSSSTLTPEILLTPHPLQGIAMLSYIASLYLVRTVARMPGNGGYARRIELASLCEHLLPKWAYLSVVLGLVASFMANNIASIVVSAQVRCGTGCGGVRGRVRWGTGMCAWSE